uniref:receptor protein-tyrosine kinase n=1 Tax=Gadus morhua TaxID=8049 RepID=A0A8C5FP43_GADMO
MPEPPILSPTGIQKINKSDHLELTCRGHQNLKWTTPLTSSQISVVDCSGSGLFCSTLVITSATANETGLYRCFFKDLKVEDDKTSASVYVFVHDYKVPFVLSEKEYEVVFIREGQPVVIPCRGSVEDLNVTLHTKFPPKEYNANGKDSVWEARTGFTIPSQLIRFAGVVFCQTKLANQTFKSPYYIVAVVGYKIHELMLTPAHVRLSVGERLVLSCTASTELNVGIDFNWTHSGHMSIHKTKFQSQPDYLLWNSLELSNTLTVDNVTVDHTGEYTCTASSGQMEKSASAFLKVYEKPFIELKDPRANLIELTVGDHTAEPLVPFKYEAYPEPSIQWYKDGLPIKVDYRVMPKNGSLVIHGVLEKDAGNYTVVLTNNLTNDKESHTFQLIVNVPPHIIEKEVAVDTDVYTYGSRATLRCTARGFPIPSHIQWEWMSREDCPQVNLDECTSWRHISNGTEHNPMDGITIDPERDHKKIVSSLKINKAEVHALYRCLAANKKGQDSRVIFFHVTRGLELTVSPSSEPIEEEPVVLRCKADRLIYRNLAWFRLSGAFDSESTTSVQPCRSLTLAQLPLSQAALSCLPGAKLSLELPLASASRHDEGMYVCQVENIKTREKICLLRSLTLRALEPARILNNMTDQKVNMSSTMVFRCDVTGTPHPSVVWTKNNHTVLEGSGVILSERNQRLTIQRVKEEDSGLYTCTACNKRSCDSSQAFLTTEGAEEKTNVELIVPIGCVVIAMFFWLLIVFVIRGRKRPTGEDVKTGYLSMILDSEDMPVDEQCERLTYDATKWEFPQDRLKLGDPLGRGAFGQVVEAAAFGIEKNTTCTTVAVKMLKEGATSSEYRALMSELKILIHIGHHLNVVNLLGACTKPGGPLMVIVEYCKNGNLSSYLKSKRGEYSPFKRQRVENARWACAEEDVNEVDLGLGTTAQLDICTGTAICTRYDSSDYDHLTMEDLISYSFQVSKGMEFLSSRKCIHRDLAARNILLSEHNVVKICDFGLARDVYKDPDYVRKGDARLPLKWMAPETIFDRVYTTQSDVWSFGVLLWEIFSLGASPYPGVCIDESFCRRLKEGTRMRAPDYATTEIYQTMLDCWLNCPTDRPTFSELVEHLGNLLQTSAQQDGKDYIPLTADEVQGCPVTSSPRGPQAFPLSGEHLDQLLRCKSKESVASEASNQTSGYQSGYHSDDTDTPIYANEDVIMKHRMLKNPPLPSKADKFNVDVRYSTPPV